MHTLGRTQPRPSGRAVVGGLLRTVTSENTQPASYDSTKKVLSLFYKQDTIMEYVHYQKKAAIERKISKIM